MLILSFVPVVFALDLIFEDGSLGGPQKITLTEVGAGTINTTYNTSSTITGLNDSSYVIRISPEAGKDYVRNPTVFLNDIVPYISDNFLVIVVFCFVIGFLALRGGRR